MTIRRAWIAVLVAAVVVRLLTLGEYPLNDTTEARYGEIARLMVVSGDWITPQIELGVPFWAKPPLSTWLTAASFKLFGFTEFAARLPALLLTLLSALLTFRIGRSLYSDNAGIIACAILFTSVLGFVAAGAVMTDTALLLAMTISLASFCKTVHEPRPRMRYGLFIGLGLGLLAKGPIAIVLIGIPIFFWTIWQRNLLWLWRGLPWIPGSVLVLAIAAPWYVLAEKNTPGFLEYFLIGEHWLRFVESGWAGDMYGNAHARPRGTIWLYAIVAALPWSIVALYSCERPRDLWNRLRSLAPVPAFLLLWVITPLVFFSFAGNILPAYALPGIPAFAILLGHWLSKRKPILALAGMTIPIVFASAAVFGLFDAIAYRSQRDLVQYHFEQTPTTNLHYFGKTLYSANFYSGGRVRSLDSEADLAKFISPASDGVVAIRDTYYSKLPEQLANCLTLDYRMHNYMLMRPSPVCHDHTPKD